MAFAILEAKQLLHNLISSDNDSCHRNENILKMFIFFKEMQLVVTQTATRVGPNYNNKFIIGNRDAKQYFF